MSANEKLIAKIKTLSTEQIVQGLQLINSDKMTPEQLIVRVRLLDEYEARLGGDAVDALMELL